MEFSSPENQKIIGRFVETDFSHLKEKHLPLHVRATMAQEIAQRLGSPGPDGAECSLDSCSFNKTHRGDGFLQVMEQAASVGKGHPITSQNLEILINVLYIDAIRFLKEHALTLPPDKKLVDELDNLLHTARKGAHGNITDAERPFDLMQYTNIGVIHASLQELIWWALYEMPQEILKGQLADLLSSTGWPEKLAFMQKEIGEGQKEIEVQKKDTEAQKTEIGELQKGIEALAKALKEHQQEYNFVRLNLGFSRLAENLERQKKRCAQGVRRWGRGIFVLPICIFVVAIGHIALFSSPSWYTWYTLLLTAPPLVTVEILSVYLYRVALLRQRSLEAQLLQVHLRMQLCAFVESYATFAKDIQRDAPETLGRFEDLIFSGIAVDPAQVPSATDGIEQVAQLIKALKDSSK